jgi:hypothetical protein
VCRARIGGPSRGQDLLNRHAAGDICCRHAGAGQGAARVFAQRKFSSSSKCFRRGNEDAMSPFAATGCGWQGFRMTTSEL